MDEALGPAAIGEQQAPPALGEHGTLLDDVLAQIEAQVRGAKSMPLSASALIDRKGVLALLEEARRVLPDELHRARQLIRDRNELLAAARGEAERYLERARHQRDELVSQTEVVQAAMREADRIIHEARQAGARMRAEAEEYVEAKLANFEVVLTKTLQTVEKGRQRMAGLLEADRLTADEPFGS